MNLKEQLAQAIKRVQELENQMPAYEHLKKCLAIAQSKIQHAEAARDDIQARFDKLQREKWDNRRSIQKEIIASLRREEPWLFDDQ